MALPTWIRECVSGASDDEYSNDPHENVLNFRRAAASRPRNQCESALALVYQAAGELSAIEDQARETEERAHSLCKSALERLQIAERRAESAERAMRAALNEADSKLQNALRALKQAQSRSSAAEAEVSAMERRAVAAESRVHEAEQALACVEDAIRTRLLGMSRVSKGGNAAAA